MPGSSETPRLKIGILALEEKQRHQHIKKVFLSPKAWCFHINCCVTVTGVGGGVSLLTCGAVIWYTPQASKERKRQKHSNSSPHQLKPLRAAGHAPSPGVQLCVLGPSWKRQ